jgi:hypothetical protein
MRAIDKWSCGDRSNDKTTSRNWPSNARWTTSPGRSWRASGQPTTASRNRNRSFHLSFERAER